MGEGVGAGVVGGGAGEVQGEEGGEGGEGVEEGGEGEGFGDEGEVEVEEVRAFREGGEAVDAARGGGFLAAKTGYGDEEEGGVTRMRLVVRRILLGRLSLVRAVWR